jgi:toxin ParE1/3/4
LDTALRFYDGASTTFGKIASMPGIGERWQSINPRLAELRVWRIDGFEKHFIFYRPTADGIEIIRVFHGARDIDNELEIGQSE